MDHSRIGEAVAAIWRIESAAVTAWLTRRTGDLGLAEDLVSEAFAAAVEQWPVEGIPPNPAAWIRTVAGRRLADHARRRETIAGKLAQLAATDATHATEEDVMDPVITAIDDPFDPDPDDQLRLIFLCCHPSLTPESRIALTLRTVAGLQTGEIARSFLASETATAQRISRAKRTLREHGAQFEIPGPAELSTRLGTVLAVAYAIFTEGHSATSGSDWTRPELCHDALRLARRLTFLAPKVGEVHALSALLEYQASRLPARTRHGRPVLLEAQDRSNWDRTLIARGDARLADARRLGGGQYLLQAEIAACHAQARTAEQTPWAQIAGHYRELLQLNGSAVVALNHAVAVGRADGPDAALMLLLELAEDARLRNYPYLPAALADTYERLGRADEARQAYLRAAELSTEATTIELFTDRARNLGRRSR